MDNQQYEFNQSQNELILDLSNKMQFVGYFSAGGGVLGIILGLLDLNPLIIIQAVTAGVIGWWTLKASSSFLMIVQTEGNDIVNLMGALGELRKLYLLQYWLLIIGLVFIALILVVTIIAVIFAGTNS